MSNLSQGLDQNGRTAISGIVSGSGYAVAQLASDSSADSATGQNVAPVLMQLANKGVALAAGTGSTAVVLKATPGYLHNFIVVTTATAALTFYDNATAASGVVLYTTSASIAAGTIVVLDAPFANGLTVSQASGTMAAQVNII